MQGSLLFFDQEKNKGILSGEDGSRYEFEMVEWKSSNKPKAGISVDFIVNDNLATEIFVINNSAYSMEFSGVIATLQNAEITSQLKSLFSSGIQNKFGFFVSLFMLTTLFFPVIKVATMFNRSGSFVGLIDHGMGILTFILLSILMLFFYSGVPKTYVRNLALLVTAAVIWQYYSLYSDISNSVFVASKMYGANFIAVLVTLIALTAVLIATFKKDYKQNSIL